MTAVTPRGPLGPIRAEPGTSATPAGAGPESDPTFRSWLAAFRGPLLGLCASWQASWREAEELALDTFAEAWLARGRFRGAPEDREAVGAWLRGIALRLHLARRRAGARRPTLPEHQLGPRGLDGLALRAEEEAADDERLVALRAAFNELPAAHQTVLRMHYLERTPARQIAALLDTTERAVEGRLHQARRRLRDLVRLTMRQSGAEVGR